MSERIILGIDPGTNVMGYGVIVHKNNKIEVIDLGVVRLARLADVYMKLGFIYEQIVRLIEAHLPDELSIESPFYAKNVQSMLKLGRAQGVAIAAAISRQVPVFEYSPRTIKQAITGNGNATKEMVARVLELNYQIDIKGQKFDATDALAIAICRALHLQNVQKFQSGDSSSWADFVKRNPHRLRKS